MPTETAEEMALEVFRTMVEAARATRSMGRAAAKRAEYGLAVRCFDYAELYRDRASDIARIIRAIRAERTPFHAMERRLADSIEGGIEAGIELIKARAYEQGRRDALRGVQGACLYEAGRLEELPKEHKRGGEYWDWSGYREEMQVHYALCEIAEAAEEAAR